MTTSTLHHLASDEVERLLYQQLHEARLCRAIDTDPLHQPGYRATILSVVSRLDELDSRAGLLP